MPWHPANLQALFLELQWQIFRMHHCQVATIISEEVSQAGQDPVLYNHVNRMPWCYTKVSKAGVLDVQHGNVDVLAEAV